MDTMEWKIGDHKCRHLPLISDFYTHDHSLLPRLLPTARIMWVCSTSSSDSVNSAQSANPKKKIKVISNTTQHVFKHIWENTQNPRKNCSKKPENKS